MKRWLAHRLTRFSIVAGVVVALSLVLAVTALATGLPPFQQTNGLQTAAQKQAKIRQVEAQETAAANEPHAPKPPPVVTTPITSCPNPTVTSAINSALETGGFHEHIISNAIVAPNGGVPFAYSIYAGALAANWQQGIIIVMRMYHDPCAPNAQGGGITHYLTPYQRGSVTVTAIHGTTLTFTTANGGSGHFDVITGKYSR